MDDGDEDLQWCWCPLLIMLVLIILVLIVLVLIVLVLIVLVLIVLVRLLHIFPLRPQFQQQWVIWSPFNSIRENQYRQKPTSFQGICTIMKCTHGCQYDVLGVTDRQLSLNVYARISDRTLLLTFLLSTIVT